MPSIIPPQITAISTLRSGISETRCVNKIIEAYTNLGIPTGNLPNGQINPVLSLEIARLQAIFDELRENVKIEVTNDLPIIAPVQVGPTGTGTAIIANIPGSFSLQGVLI